MDLTQERLKELLTYNPDTGLFHWAKHRGGRAKVGVRAGVVGKDGAVVIRVDDVLYRAHRLAWLYEYGVWPDEIDHVDCDPSNNRMINLRDCSRAENTRNVRAHRDSASGLKGAYFSCGSWFSTICRGGETKYLGRHPSAVAAAAAYDAAAIDLHGVFARTNGS